MERGEWREGDHHTQRSSSFLWTNARLTLGCPAGLSSSLMCSPQPLLPALLPLLPRRPGRHLPDGAPPRPAVPPPRHPSQQHLRHGASAVALSAPAGSCFPMLPHCLPCRDPRGAATFPHRLPLRSIPPAALRLRAPSHSRGGGH